jgi:hypothetical protein
VAAETATLLDRLAGSGWTAAGSPVAWFYDPPWTIPALRRNEVAVIVATAGCVKGTPMTPSCSP